MIGFRFYAKPSLEHRFWITWTQRTATGSHFRAFPLVQFLRHPIQQWRGLTAPVLWVQVNE